MDQVDTMLLSQISGVLSVTNVLCYGFILLVTWYCYKIFLAPYFSPLYKIPGCPYRPIVGNMLEARRSEAMTNCLRWMAKYKSKIIRFYYFGGSERILVADPDIFRHIMVSNSRNYHRVGQTSSRFSFFVGGVPLFALSGEPHHTIRKISNPAFSLHALHDMIPVFADCAKILSTKMKSMITEKGAEADLEVQKMLVQLTLEVICRCGFDYELNAIQNPYSEREKKLRRLFQNFGPGFFDFLPFSQYFPTKSNRELQADLAFTKEFSEKLIELNKKKDANRRNLLSRLITARDEEGGGLTDKELLGQVFGFLLAGFETTSTGMTWILLQLAQHTDIQDKVRKEVTEVLAESQSEITPEVLSKMKYLTCVIKETLRLFPPVTCIFRRALTDDTLNGYHIPKGTVVGLHIGALHRLNWDDPDDFKPERFMLQEEPEGKKFFPFAFGPYMCIGNKFSMLEMKTVLATLLREFKFTMTPGYSFRRVQRLVMVPHPSAILHVESVSS